MSISPIISIDGKKYMSVKTAADLWGLSPRTVSDYCKNDRIINKIKPGGHWYIWIDEIKPLSIKEIRKLLVLSLQLKNRPSLEIDWSTFSFDYSAIEIIYRNLADQGYIEEFYIKDKKRIPYEVVLTQKGFNIVTTISKEKNATDFSSALQQWLPIVVDVAQLIYKIAQMAQ